MGLWALVGCEASETPDFSRLRTVEQAASVLSIAGSGCSSGAVQGLENQLFDEINCMTPGALADISNLDVSKGFSSTRLVLEGDAAKALGRAIPNGNRTFIVNSAYRSIAQQFLFYTWNQQGRCGIGAAAYPGSSNHQGGRALDVREYDYWRPKLQAQGWVWPNIPNDPWHFNYSGGTDLRPTSVKAFQRLWNRNNPSDQIAVDGDYGPITNNRLGRSPGDGFPIGAVCNQPPPDPPDPPAPVDEPLWAQAWRIRGSDVDVNGDGLADVCARVPGGGVECALALPEGGFAEPFADAMLEGASGWNDPSNAATLRFGDVNGDGLADICARANAGVRCYPSQGDSFGAAIVGPEWSDAAGFDAAPIYLTFAVADVTGDGLDDVCIRASEGVLCAASTGDGFVDLPPGPALSDAAGWDAPEYFATLRYGDVDGDGDADLCARSADGMQCWRASSGGFTGDVLAGPSWSDAAGWDTHDHYATIELIDLDDDGMADLTARADDGMHYALANGAGFGDDLLGPDVDNSKGFDEPTKYMTLQYADLNDDGNLDLCGRYRAGMRCWLFAGTSFATEPWVGPFDDSGGWAPYEHFASIQLGDIDADGNADLCGRGPEGWRCHRSNGTGFEPSAVAGPSWTTGFDVQAFYSSVVMTGPRRRARPVVVWEGEPLVPPSAADTDVSPVLAEPITSGSDMEVAADAATAGHDRSVDQACACAIRTATQPARTAALPALLFALGMLASRRRRPR